MYLQTKVTNGKWRKKDEAKKNTQLSQVALPLVSVRVGSKNMSKMIPTLPLASIVLQWARCLKICKISFSPSGNWTPVSRVTGGDTYHYTNEESYQIILHYYCYCISNWFVYVVCNCHSSMIWWDNCRNILIFLNEFISFVSKL